jgi:aryl-alcohol dehydrogenase-like predicted oxidoreductase
MPELRNIGSSGLRTPRLVLGGNVFGWTAKGEDAFRILDRFAEAGGTMIDTADVYSAWVPGHKGGESESLIGEWLRRRGGQGDIEIPTKVGMLPGEGGEKLEPARIAAAAEASLKRLGVEAIDLYYAHQDDTRTPLADSLAAFDRLVRDGKVRVIGASNYSAERLGEALAISEREGLARYQVLQNEYNLMARDKFEGPLQRLCVERNIGMLPYYGLASGFLTGKYRSAADQAGPNRPRLARRPARHRRPDRQREDSRTGRRDHRRDDPRAEPGPGGAVDRGEHRLGQYPSPACGRG